MTVLISYLLCLCLSSLAANSSPTALSPLRRIIQSYAALGDSYAAGAGAGLPQGFACGRYSDAYPVQVANSTRLSIQESDFKNLACGGTTSATVLRDQVPHIANSDLASITVGGNEVDFFLVLNACIYHWWPASTCEAAIVKARGLIESSVLQNNFQELVSGAVQRLKPSALLLVTGYARFFNDQTDYCNHATFSRSRPLDYLTKTKRRALNQLLVLLNDVIRATAEVHGAVYLDIDSAFEGHRFCEEGVQEPDIEREETWFFNLPAADMGQDAPAQGWRLQVWSSAPDSEEARLHGFPNMEALRTFHPTSLGHLGISEAIVKEALAQVAGTD